MRALLALAAVALLAPLAAAHLETFSEAKPLVLGPYNGIVEPYPSPAYENTAVTLRAIFSRTATGEYVSSRDLRATADVRAPDGTNTTRPLEPDGTGYFVAYVVVRQAGDHVVRIAVEDAQGRHENDTTLTVYRDFGVRLRPADPDVPDPVVGRPYPIGVVVLENTTLQPTDRLKDLRARIEHWSDDHKSLLGQEEVVLQKARAGTWMTEYAFPEKGMFHLRFASSSGGFNYDDVPLLHVYANEPPPPGPAEPKEAPLGPAAALAALALVALARRR